MIDNTMYYPEFALLNKTSFNLLTMHRNANKVSRLGFMVWLCHHLLLT
jgi:hypothetical protein